MVIDNGFDQLEAAPLSSVALARTLNVFVDPEATVHLWDTLTDMPELTRDVVEMSAISPIECVLHLVSIRIGCLGDVAVECSRGA